MKWYLILIIVLGSLGIGFYVFLRIVDLIFGGKPTNLGLQSGKLSPMKKTPKGVNSYTDYEPQKMAAFPYKGTKETAVKMMVNVLKNLKTSPRITFYEINLEKGYIWARDISLFMRWKDDIEFYFDDDHMVQFRSSPRYGTYDWGFNRKRMELIRDEFLKQQSTY
ncbi:MAG: DUF1499 domain-containing protein [Candidatus Lokiarchaeota archaeon]|nr:DUF1499 domain-containing protein [Candidatus Lokiarchaeota archaeon]